MKPTKLILDACCNHLGLPLMMAEMIAKAGEFCVDFIKFQLYDHKKINKKCYSTEYIDFMKSCQIKKDMIETIYYSCGAYDSLNPMFTIFHPEVLSMLNPKFDDVLKIGSPDATKPWVDEVVNFSNGDVYISLGMCSQAEKDALIKKYKQIPKVKFLSCVSMYPCKPNDLDVLEALKLNGLSCHTNDIAKIKEVLNAGVENLELHYTLGKYLPGVDQHYAVDVKDVEYITKYRGYLENVKRYKKRFG